MDGDSSEIEAGKGPLTKERNISPLESRQEKELMAFYDIANKRKRGRAI